MPSTTTSHSVYMRWYFLGLSGCLGCTVLRKGVGPCSMTKIDEPNKGDATFLSPQANATLLWANLRKDSEVWLRVVSEGGVGHGDGGTGDSWLRSDGRLTVKGTLRLITKSEKWRRKQHQWPRSECASKLAWRAMAFKARVFRHSNQHHVGCCSEHSLEIYIFCWESHHWDPTHGSWTPRPTSKELLMDPAKNPWPPNQVLLMKTTSRYVSWPAFYTEYAGTRGLSGYVDGSRLKVGAQHRRV